MRLSGYGRREEKIIILLGAIGLAVGCVLWLRGFWVSSSLLVGCVLLLGMFLLYFFRDPTRKADIRPFTGDCLLAPADGRITDIEEVEELRLGGRALRIGIFLSIFDVHINRSPCYGRVVDVVYRKGKFINAMKRDSSVENECNEIVIELQNEHCEDTKKLPNRIIVRQIAGLIARRIVCELKVGDHVRAGQRFGMIKFGSRTELLIPLMPFPTIHVEVGQKVCAGDDILVSY